jgi:hypothetical protein
MSSRNASGIANQSQKEFVPEQGVSAAINAAGFVRRKSNRRKNAMPPLEGRDAKLTSK